MKIFLENKDGLRLHRRDEHARRFRAATWSWGITLWGIDFSDDWIF